MNNAVELARESLEKCNEYDLQEMFMEAISRGIEFKLCKSCMARSGLSDSKIRPEVAVATMPEIVEWIVESERVLTF